MTIYRTLGLLACLVWAVPAVPAAAAQAWYFETEAGRVRPDFAPVAEPAGFLEGLRNVSLGVRMAHGVSGARFSIGVPTRKDEPLWGAAGGWHRFSPLGGDRWFAGVDLSGSAYVARQTAPGVANPGVLPVPGPAPGGASYGYAMAGQALPVVGFRSSRLEVQGRSGMSLYARRTDGGELDHPVWQSDAQALVSPVPWLGIGPVVRHYRTSTDSSSYAGGNAVVGVGTVSLWGGAGRWLEGGPDEMPWSLGGSVRVHPRLTVYASHRRETFDPVYLRQPQSSWSVGLSVQISGPLPGRDRALVAAAPVSGALTSGADDGRVTIRVAVEEAPSPPRIAGDFNDWEPQPMLRAGGYWTYTARISPGVYNYAFVDDMERWFVPDSAPGRRSDGMGGFVAVLVVSS